MCTSFDADYCWKSINKRETSNDTWCQQHPISLKDNSDVCVPYPGKASGAKSLYLTA